MVSLFCICRAVQKRRGFKNAFDYQDRDHSTFVFVGNFICPDENINSSVIAIADFTRQYLISDYKIPEDKVKLLYQGTDLIRYRSSLSAKKEAKKRYLVPEEASPILGIIGSIEPRKGHKVLFEAIKKTCICPFSKYPPDRCR